MNAFNQRKKKLKRRDRSHYRKILLLKFGSFLVIGYFLWRTTPPITTQGCVACDDQFRGRAEHHWSVRGFRFDIEHVFC